HRPRRRRRAEPRRRHAARHRHILRRASDPTRQVLVRASLGERDDPVAPRGCPPLERRIDGGAPRTKVPVEDVAVRLVDDGGHPLGRAAPRESFAAKSSIDGPTSQRARDTRATEAAAATSTRRQERAPPPAREEFLSSSTVSPARSTRLRSPGAVNANWWMIG